MRRSRIGTWVKRLVLAVFVTGLAFVGWSVGIEPGLLVVRHHTVSVAGWPSERSPYRIAFVTDLHVGSPHVGLDKLAQVVADTNAQKADLILLGGDFLIDGVVGGSPASPQEIAEGLRGLTAPDGVYAVLGNHDNWNDGPGMRRALEDAGITVLDDESVRIGDGEAGFTLVGVSDFDTAAHDVARAMQGVGGPTILLTHSPDVFPAIPDTVGLTLAGHTHGGQVYVPFVGRPVVPSIYGQRYAIGLIHEGAKTLYVSPGIGTSIFPIRFLTPPEITILRLVEPGVSLPDEP